MKLMDGSRSLSSMMLTPQNENANKNQQPPIKYGENLDMSF